MRDVIAKEEMKTNHTTTHAAVQRTLPHVGNVSCLSICERQHSQTWAHADRQTDIHINKRRLIQVSCCAPNDDPNHGHNDSEALRQNQN